MPKKHEEEMENCLRELRTRHGWTQQALADQVNVSRQTIIAIERGQYSPSAVLALKIARVFQLPLEELFWLKTTSPNQSGN